MKRRDPPSRFPKENPAPPQGGVFAFADDNNVARSPPSATPVCRLVHTHYRPNRGMICLAAAHDLSGAVPPKLHPVEGDGVFFVNGRHFELRFDFATLASPFCRFPNAAGAPFVPNTNPRER